MVDGTDTTVHANQNSCYRITEPNTKPRLPPRQADIKRHSGNQESIDIETVGYPKIYEADVAPLPSLGLDRFQVVVGIPELASGVVASTFALLQTPISTSCVVSSLR